MGTPSEHPPLVLEPIVREKPWGGDWLQKHLNKQAPPGALVGESWEAVSLHETSSRIRGGTAGGGTLRDLLISSGPDLLGRESADGGLPLLFKYIHAREKLSLQVHPDHDLAERHSGRREGKMEAWRILRAEEGATLWIGLRPGIDRGAFEEAIRRGEALDCLVSHPARPGDTYLIPTGGVHTLGGGVLLAEIQEASDLTYRFTDWGRDSAAGGRREVQLGEAFEAADLDLPGPFRLTPAVDRVGTVRREVFDCRRFVFEALEGTGRWEGPRPDGFEIVSVAAGEVEISTDAGTASLGLGETAFLPKGKAPLTLKMRGAQVFRSYLPGGTTA